jgi:hypothetical protein
MAACSASPQPIPATEPDAIPDVAVVTDVVLETSDDGCVQTQLWWCPPWHELWQRQMVIDTCTGVIVEQGECEQKFDCNPAIPNLGSKPCTTEDGLPGELNVYCSKGWLMEGKCETECTEEICDYKDNDCDGEVDEGQQNLCGACGHEPPEICNGLDDDCDGTIDEDLYRPCESACGLGLEGCYSGQWLCDAPQPVAEECDFIDNDCDGLVDEGLDCGCTASMVGVLIPCSEQPLTCGQGYRTCLPDFTFTECWAFCWHEGNLASCDAEIGTVMPEQCNNFDDDCDSYIDENITGDCYGGPDGTDGVGECVAGTTMCLEGSWSTCAGQVVPTEEVCNGVDDDCDGDTDFGEELNPTDILFIVDWSGSMDMEINAVMGALSMFANQYKDEDIIKWGVAVAPFTPGENLKLVSNLVGFTDFWTAFGSLVGGISGGTEMILDAIYLCLIGPIPLNWSVAESDPPSWEWAIDWRGGADRVIIVFSDEHPQSYSIPKITPDNIVSVLGGAYVYTFSTGFGMVQWKKMSDASGGEWNPLTNDALTMYAHLTEILGEHACSTK